MTGARYLSKPKILEVWLPLDPLVRVLVACQDPRCDGEAEIVERLLALDPDVQVLEKALQPPASRLSWHCLSERESRHNYPAEPMRWSPWRFRLATG